MTSKYIGSRSSLPKIATFGPPRAEKLIFSDKTLACSNDCAPKLMNVSRRNCMRRFWTKEGEDGLLFFLHGI